MMGKSSYTFAIVYTLYYAFQTKKQQKKEVASRDIVDSQKAR